MTASHRFRELLDQPGCVIAPGIFDGLSARLTQDAGFAAGYLTGGGASVSALGLPDFGLMTMTETVLHAQRMTAVLDIPIICDADTGYGGPANVTRTVQELERAGVAGFHLEDQVFPKRCGFLPDKELVPGKEFAETVAVARDATQDPETVIIARTDARAVEGMDAALERARAYHEAGADLIFIEALHDRADIERVAAEAPGRQVINMISSSRTPVLERAELDDLGFSLAIYPIITLVAAAEAMKQALDQLKSEGNDSAVSHLWSPEELHAVMGVAEWSALQARTAGLS